MISCERSSWVSDFAPAPARSTGAGKAAEDLVVEEVRERAVPHVVEEAGDSQRLDDQALGRDADSPRARAGRTPRSDG